MIHGLVHMAHSARVHEFDNLEAVVEQGANVEHVAGFGINFRRDLRVDCLGFGRRFDSLFAGGLALAGGKLRRDVVVGIVTGDNPVFSTPVYRFFGLLFLGHATLFFLE